MALSTEGCLRESADVELNRRDDGEDFDVTKALIQSNFRNVAARVSNLPPIRVQHPPPVTRRWSNEISRGAFGGLAQGRRATSSSESTIIASWSRHGLPVTVVFQVSRQEQDVIEVDFMLYRTWTA